MKKISIMILVLVVALASCKKTPEVNLKYVDVERDLITVGTTTATVQCDYQYIATLKKAYFYYGEGQDEADMNTAEMRVVQNTLYVELAGLKENTTYSYYYEFYNGFNSMRTALKTFKTEAGNGGGEEPPTPPEITLPTVITASVTEITSNSAKGGGEVTNDGGVEVTERGICWGTNENPTINDNHVATGTGTGAFTVMMESLEANTIYHVRAYATNEAGTAYGLDREFATLEGGSAGDHEYVDLGLPSGLLWATCNVGADSPEEYGDYFAWGETQPKDIYDWSNYQHCNGSNNTLTKYCPDPCYGYNGFSDNLSTLLPDDDAATVNWGNNWRMPTAIEWSELYQNTTSIWTNQNGVNGRLFIASNGNSLFLPAAGGSVGTLIPYCYMGMGFEGHYWSSSLYLSGYDTAWWFALDSVNYGPGYGGHGRCCGMSIRPVCLNSSPPNSIPEGTINGLFTINENGDQVYFSQGNLQYRASTNTWKFAEHQWDCVGEANVNISPTYDGWIDLFGWGTSGYNHGAICYQPWSTSTNNEDYFAYGLWNANLYEETGQADWGYNQISNGGNTTNQWRTLTLDEWHYVVFRRLSAKAKVNDVCGLILLPDYWDEEIFYLNDLNQYGAPYSSNTISISDWSILEANGAVFLPADFGNYYWSSQIMESNSAKVLWLNALHQGTYYSNFRSSRLKVRLVQDANP